MYSSSLLSTGLLALLCTIPGVAAVPAPVEAQLVSFKSSQPGVNVTYTPGRLLSAEIRVSNIPDLSVYGPGAVPRDQQSTFKTSITISLTENYSFKIRKTSFHGLFGVGHGIEARIKSTYSFGGTKNIVVPLRYEEPIGGEMNEVYEHPGGEILSPCGASTTTIHITTKVELIRIDSRWGSTLVVDGQALELLWRPCP